MSEPLPHRMWQGGCNVEGTYEVISGGQAVGSVVIRRQGLYYHIRCLCHLSGEGMFRLILEVGERTIDLGIMVPTDSFFGLQTRLSAKSLGTGSIHFHLKPQRNSENECLISVCPEEPFQYLSRLESAYLACRKPEVRIGFRTEK